MERRWEEEQQLPAYSPGFSCWSAFSLTSDHIWIRSGTFFRSYCTYRLVLPHLQRHLSLIFVQILRLAIALKWIFVVSLLHGVRLVFIGPLALFLRYLIQNVVFGGSGFGSCLRVSCFTFLPRKVFSTSERTPGFSSLKFLCFYLV